MEQVSCDGCGRWFWTDNLDAEYCSECVPKKVHRSWETYTKTGGDLGKKIFDIVVSHREKGVGIYDVLKQLKESYGLDIHGTSNILSSLDRTGYLVYLDNHKLFPYKDIHTGVEYE